MNITRFHLLSLIFVLMICPIFIFGQQDTGQITGTVRDQNDAIVVGASVKVTNPATGITKSVTTNSDGNFVVVGLIPTTYTVSATATNFKESSVKTNVTVGGVSSVAIKLGIQNTSNVVNVIAESGELGEINTTDQQQSSVVSRLQIASLPTLDRNPYALVNLSGNVSTADPDGRGAGVSINGLRSASTDILLDGSENAATFSQTVAQTVPIDAVSEFRVLTNTFAAEYGRASGGVVNVATRSGTNNFEGSVFEQNRNSALSSNGFDNNSRGIPRSHFNRNQFGGTVSGPIIKNKLFFLDSLEITRIRSAGTVTRWIPTASFLSTAAANTQAFFTTYGTLAAKPNGVVSSDGQFRQVTYTAPIDAGGGTPTNDWNNVARVDWNLSDKTSFFFSYKAQNNGNLTGTSANSPYSGYDATTKVFNQNFLVSGTHSFSSNLIFDGKLTYRRAVTKTAVGSKSPNSPTLYWYDQASPTLNGVCIAFPGYLPCSPGAGLNAPETEQLWDVKPNATWIEGSHTVRFGGQYVHLNDDNIFAAYQNASEGLSGSNYAQATANFLSGTVVRFQVAVNPQGKYPGGTVTLPVAAPNFQRTNVYDEFALYAQDSWRVARNLTLNLGVRYEYYGPQKSTQGLDSNFYFGTGANRFQQIRNGHAGPASANGGLWKADKNNWAPRIGFAWDITGDGKTSLRGGYGIGYERNFGNVTFNVIQNPPYYAVLSVPGSVSNNNFGPLAGTTGTATLPRSSLRAVDPNIVNAYAHQWGLSIERQVLPNTAFKLDYSGSAGRKLYSISNINRTGTGTYYLGSIATTGCNGLAATDRLNCGFSNINYRGSDGTSNYYSFSPSIESSNLLHSGLSITARYTYAVSKDNLSSTFSSSSNNLNLGYLDPFNPMLDYGYSDSDMRHRFVAAIVYPIAFKLENHMLNSVVGGWNISATYESHSATPFTIFDENSCNITTCYRLINGGKITYNGKTIVDSGSSNLNNYIVISGAPTAADILGNNEVGPYPTNMSRRNSFRGLGFWDANLSLYKTITLTERYKLQIRMEAINVFNHANTFVDGANAYVLDSGSGNEGTIQTNKSGRRTAQISAKFIF